MGFYGIIPKEITELKRKIKSKKSFNLNMNTMKLCRIKTPQKYYRKEMGWGKARERRRERRKYR